MAGVRDLIVISGLAIRASIAYKDAPHDYRHISEDVAVLKCLIDTASPCFKSTAISREDQHYGEKVLEGCQGVLEDLMALIEKYKRLACINKRTVLNGVKLGQEDITALQVRLISNTGLLRGFVRSCEYLEVQAQLATLLSPHGTANPKIPKIPITSIAFLAANTTEPDYKQFCSDLYRIGVAENTVLEKEDEILEILSSRGMISISQIGNIGEKDRVLEAAYKGYCEDLYRMGFTDDMILQQKDQILGILRSRGVVAKKNAEGCNLEEGSNLEEGCNIKDKDDSSSSTKVMPSFKLSSRVNWFESSSDSTPLHTSASSSHTGIVELVLGKGSSTDQENNMTPLHVTAKRGYTGLAELLLGSTRLKGRTGVMGLLFSKGVPIDAMDSDNNTPLRLAIMNGHTDIVELLLSKGASIGLEEWVGTPLHCAALDGCIGIVELLLQKGASVEAKTEWGGRTPLHGAAKSGHTGIVELLLKHGASIEANSEGYTPLHYAAQDGHTGVVELLLEKGALTNVRDDNNCTPLHSAASRGHTDIVRLLLEKGASANVMNSTNYTPLHSAASKGHTDIVKLLLERGAPINAMDDENDTALHYAASNGHTDTVKLLLEGGASIDAKNDFDDTPLHKAAISGHTSTAKLLLEEGASLEAKNLIDKIPLHYAEQYNHPEMAQLFKNKAC